VVVAAYAIQNPVLVRLVCLSEVLHLHYKTVWFRKLRGSYWENDKCKYIV